MQCAKIWCVLHVWSPRGCIVLCARLGNTQCASGFVPRYQSVLRTRFLCASCARVKCNGNRQCARRLRFLRGIKRFSWDLTRVTFLGAVSFAFMSCFPLPSPPPLCRRRGPRPASVSLSLPLSLARSPAGPRLVLSSATVCGLRPILLCVVGRPRPVSASGPRYVDLCHHSSAQACLLVGPGLPHFAVSSWA